MLMPIPKLNLPSWTNRINLVIFLLLLTNLGTYYLYIQARTNTNQIKQSYEKLLSNYQQTVLLVPSPTFSIENEKPSTIELDKIQVNWTKNIEAEVNSCVSYGRCFLVGKISNKDSRYLGKDLFLQVTENMGGSEMNHYIIESNQDGSLRKLYVRETSGNTPGAVIAGIDDIPEEIIFPNSTYKLKKHYSPAYLFSELTIGNRIFTHPTLGNFYLTDDGCLVAKMPDGTAIGYDFNIPFLEDKKNKLAITLNNNQKNTEEYGFTRASCGGACTYLQTVSPENIKPDTRLELAGKTSTGESIYKIKDPQDKVLQDLYNDKGTVAYMNTEGNSEGGQSKYTYLEFLNLNPYLYWKDPLGRWVEFRNYKLATAAEMCKPVIYLYPQKETELDIKINISGWLTKSVPLYNQGWKVLADPTGKIKNLTDGKYYDYLVWEGIGINYPEIDQGFVVKQADLKSFLTEKLELLGLNPKEASDFKQYWLNRLADKPYYKISFLSSNQFEELATVDFSPNRPDVFIRVMMTAQGLDTFEKLPEQRLPTKAPTRGGFTAVEWGGALIK